MKNLNLFNMLLFLVISLGVKGQNIPEYVANPILPGFNPDPSICRVNEDYYLVTSSFSWYPGIPIYHSKDLVNWQIIGHGIHRPDMIDMNGLNDNDGIWATTIRYHNGLFYLITTANKSGGNFYITASDPKGPWSDPVWLEGATGIDPSLFWDDDGRCYYTGNAWDFKKQWPSQCAVWMQELDLEQKKLVGERKILAYGHANNATYAEGPHIYKIDGKYLLLMAEGGSGYHHAVTVHQSNSLWGPYIADTTNPVLTHRHLGSQFPIQTLGHADIVQTQNGEWYSVFLGKRVINGYSPLARETFLSKVVFENSTPIFNPGIGTIQPQLKKPNLPWTPVKVYPARDEFDTETLSNRWYFVRIPQKSGHQLKDGQLILPAQPEVIDSLVNAAMIIQKIKHHHFTATTKLTFQATKDNEQAGIVLYRSANGYYSLLKDKTGISLIKKYIDDKKVIARLPYDKTEVLLSVSLDSLEINFGFGEALDKMSNIGGPQSIDVISDSKLNKFNGPGVGMYATSNGQKSTAKAHYEWFEYSPGWEVTGGDKAENNNHHTFPDGTPLSEWFFQNDVYSLSSLGRKYDVQNYGIGSNPALVQTEKIQAIIDKAASNGGGVIYFPEGIYKSGALHFKQGTHLYLTKGATLLGSENIMDFPLCTTRIEGETCTYFPALVNADSLNIFFIGGEGTIDGNGTPYWKAFRTRQKWNFKLTNKDEMRPRLVYISNCSNVQIADVNLQNSPYWTSHFYRCEYVKIINVRFYAPSKPVSSPSTDGIDMDVCHNFHIKGCRFTVNDDAICFKGGKGPYADKDSTNGPVRNVLVEDCLFDNTMNSCVTCGSEAIHVRNFLMRNCEVKGAREFFRLKMRLDTPQLYEYITIENVAGFCKTFFVVQVWKQFFDLKGRKDIPKSYGNNISLCNIEMKCDRFVSTQKNEEAYELANFLFKDITIEAGNTQWDKEVFGNIDLKNVVLNGQHH